MDTIKKSAKTNLLGRVSRFFSSSIERKEELRVFLYRLNERDYPHAKHFAALPSPPFPAGNSKEVAKSLVSKAIWDKANKSLGKENFIDREEKIRVVVRKPKSWWRKKPSVMCSFNFTFLSGKQREQKQQQTAGSVPRSFGGKKIPVLERGDRPIPSANARRTKGAALS